MPPTQRARSRNLRRRSFARNIRSAVLEGLEQLHGSFWGQIFVVLVVDLDHGGVDAGAEALDFDEGEEAVGGCLALLNTELGLDSFDNGVGAAAAELTGCLDKEFVSKDGFSLKSNPDVSSWRVCNLQDNHNFCNQASQPWIQETSEETNVPLCKPE